MDHKIAKIALINGEVAITVKALAQLHDFYISVDDRENSARVARVLEKIKKAVEKNAKN